MNVDQAEFDIRCEWGQQGVDRLAPSSDVVIIVDILSFSTCVDIAVGRGARVFPYRWHDPSAARFAASIGAELAGGRRGETGYSLSPASLLAIPPGTRLLLPSHNGATLTFGSGATPTLSGCFRNSRAVAAAAQRYGRRIAVIPAAERWDDGSLRPAVEDWLGAGAIVSHLTGMRSPEARAAVAAYHHARANLAELLKHCRSGQELLARGFEQDVLLAAALDVSTCVPTLVDGAYVHAEGSPPVRPLQQGQGRPA